jgi:hypothetical protein
MYGDLETYTAELANAPVYGNPVDNDLFAPMDGEPVGEMSGMSNAQGDFFKKTTAGKVASFIPVVAAGRAIAGTPEGRARRQAARQQRRDARTQSKLNYSQAQLEAAKGLGKESGLDKALAGSLTAKKSGGSKGLSTGAWVGIAIGGAVVIGLGIFAIMKMRKK